MASFISAADGGYYEGDQVSPHDAAVPQRPDATYDWSGAAWVQNQARVAPRLWAQKLAAGVVISSITTPALNGTYPIADFGPTNWQQKIQAIADGLSNGKGLPHGQLTVGWPDIAGQLHQFTAADFISFAKAVEDYVYDLAMTESALVQGSTTATWPAQPSPIP